MTVHFVFHMHSFLPEAYTICIETFQIWRRIKVRTILVAVHVANCHHKVRALPVVGLNVLKPISASLVVHNVA